jgi:acetyltransferase-like isoleucine patch superfamily enzyme
VNSDSFPPSPRSHSSYDDAVRTGRLRMGPYSYGRPLVHVYAGDLCGVRVGAFCSIGEDVEFLPGGMHDASRVSTFPFRARLGLPPRPPDEPMRIGDTVVGSDVWIGRGARILSGVTIGPGAVVGAYAVVAADVRPYAVVVGNPAREVRRRFDDDTVARLLDAAWWDWPVEELERIVPLLNDAPPQRLLDWLSGERRSGERRSGPVAAVPP